ncbi:sensor histidine kinase [Kamptonema formosum]|uniref:sensor histidine kinase n=1 Tax=Kamptonema formosum TaxID=331992 RepID=UPI000349607B|nr:ATP-binding protein [Oscillatoria sp. PCC 10802]
MLKYRQRPHQLRWQPRNIAVLFILAGTTLAVGALALASYQVVRELILQQLREKALLEVQQGINEIDRWLATRKAEVETLANTPVVGSLDWEVSGPYLKSEVERLNEYHHFTFAYSDGSYYNTKVGYAQGKNLADRLWFQRAMAGEVYVSDPLISRSTGIVQVLVAAPIGERSQPQAVLGGAIKIDRLDRVVSRLHQGPNSYAFALNSEGRAIVHPDPKLRGTVEKPAPSLLEISDSNLAAISRRMVSQQQAIELTQLDGNWYYVAFAPLQEAHWSVGLAIPRENLESQLLALNVLASVLGGLLAIAILGAWRQVRLLEKSQEQVKLLAKQAAELNQALAQLKQTQAQLVQSEKMSGLGQMVAGIAHEINNPVNFIYGNLPHVTEYLRELMQLLTLYQAALPALPPEIAGFEQDIDFEFVQQDLPSTLASMKVGAERIRQIVLSLRNFSRLDEAEKKEVDLHEGIDSTLLLLHHRLKDKIQVLKHYGNLPLVECYPSQMNQVFMNLISNAIDAVSDAPQPEKLIEITTGMVETAGNLLVRIGVRDSGPGVPVEIQSKIFDPFFTTKPIGKGTGLGLAICYQIVVQVHQGRIWMESRPKKGTEFIIEFPARPSQASLSAPSGPHLSLF